MQRSLNPARRAYRLLNRPYYWWRPSQLARRAVSRPVSEGPPQLLRTAWGATLWCFPDPVGQAVARTGVYDLTVAETLTRLALPGEIAVDAGANVGLMTNLLAHAVGGDGRVVCFEPHPLIFETLSRNVEHWRAQEAIGTIDARQAAVSSSAGELPLGVDPDTFAQNKGTASLEQRDPAHTLTTVRVVRLDDELPQPVGVLKLDVEMHELEALRGAETLLSRQLVRDIVFEEHEPPPTPVTALLESHGYSLFGLRQGIMGPIASEPSEAYELQLWDPPALLATADAQRARRLLAPRGWVCLKPGLGARRR